MTVPVAESDSFFRDRDGEFESHLLQRRVMNGGYRLLDMVRARGARCRASFFHWRKDGSPLTLQQHRDEPGRLRVAGVAPHDVNIFTAWR